MKCKKTPENQKKFFDKSLEYARKGISLNDKHYACHKWFAISTSSVGNFLPTKEKIKDAYLIKEHALKAAELNPNDATTQFVLGKWCYSVANVDFVTRTAASLLFATPPTSTFNEALGYLLKSEELNPNNIRNRLLIGDTYMAMKDQTKAKEWYQKASETPIFGDVEKVYLEEAKTKLNQKSGWF